MTGEERIRKAAGGFAGLGLWIKRAPIRWKLAWKDYQDDRQARFMRQQAKTPTLRERQEDLIRFYGQYENLIDVLCDAAQYGPDGRLESRYSEVRLWLQANYPGLRRFVSAYLRYDSGDAARSLDLHGSGRDAFEALYAAPTLEHFMRSDDGRMIERIDRTREALGRYGDHLRQLIAQERSA